MQASSLDYLLEVDFFFFHVIPLRQAVQANIFENWDFSHRMSLQDKVIYSLWAHNISLP